MVIKKYKSNEISNLQLSEHFMASELNCNHCGELIIDTDLINKLENLRELINAPINITSGYRCPLWNKHEGGATNSLHTLGKAVDFNLNNKFNGVDILNKTTRIFNRVGFYESNKPNCCYIHVDVGPNTLYWLSRKVNGVNKYQYFKSMDMLHANMRNDSYIQWYKLLI